MNVFHSSVSRPSETFGNFLRSCAAAATVYVYWKIFCVVHTTRIKKEQEREGK